MKSIRETIAWFIHMIRQGRKYVKPPVVVHDPWSMGQKWAAVRHRWHCPDRHLARPCGYNCEYGAQTLRGAEGT